MRRLDERAKGGDRRLDLGRARGALRRVGGRRQQPAALTRRATRRRNELLEALHRLVGEAPHALLHQLLELRRQRLQPLQLRTQLPCQLGGAGRAATAPPTAAPATAAAAAPHVLGVDAVNLGERTHLAQRRRSRLERAGRRVEDAWLAILPQ